VAYFDKVLQPGERILVKGRLHWVIYLTSYVVMLIAAVVALASWLALSKEQSSMEMIGFAVAGLILVYGIVLFIGRMFVRMGSEFAVTDHRVLVKRGLISVHTVEMNVDKVESVDVDQGILGRMLGYGSVTVHGVGSRWDPIPGLAHPLRFRNAITARAQQDVAQADAPAA
jgi:membrane protein YdbS with pleckstrin-like domain